MADQKITQLTSITALTNDDIIPVVNDPGSTPVTNKITWANVKATLAAAYALIANGSANLKMFMNAAGTSAEWANGMKIASFTYDTATASGTQAITGVGFKPSHIIFLAAISNTNQMSIGFSNGTANYCFADYNATGTGTYLNSTTTAIYLIQTSGGAIGAYATVSTLGADGFTLTWTKDGSKTGTATIFYLALR
jgi:hypothetical protein